jgi:hypothetical protein
MKSSLPNTAKVSKDAKECVQECVSEFISFIVSLVLPDRSWLTQDIGSSREMLKRETEDD